MNEPTFYMLEDAAAGLAADDWLPALEFLVYSENPEAETIISAFLRAQGYPPEMIPQLTKETFSPIHQSLDKRLAPKVYHEDAIAPFAVFMLHVHVFKRDLQAFVPWGNQHQANVYTVFTIDDMPLARTIGRMVINASHNLISIGDANDWQKSLSFLPELAPDILIIDHMVPGKDGLEIMRYYRPLLPNTTFVFCSYRYPRDQEIASIAAEAGADHIETYGFFDWRAYIDMLVQAHQRKIRGTV